MASVIVELDRNDKEFYAAIIDELGSGAKIVETSRFDGVLVLQILASLNAVALPLIAKLIIEAIKANRYVVVKSKGVEIKGLSADDTLRVLRELK